MKEGGLGIPSRQILNLQVRLVEYYHQAIAFKEQQFTDNDITDIKKDNTPLHFIQRIEYNL